MKKYIYFILLGLLLNISSCTDGILDKKPLDIISDAVVWNDQVLIDAYLTQTYLQMYILTNETPYSSSQVWASSDDWNGPFIINELSDECKRNWISGQSNAKLSGIQVNGGILEWWENAYIVIRTLNVFIEQIKNAPVEETFRKSREAEARFLRAYNYFAMVKRYGGVPLIIKAQDIKAEKEELYRKRDKEQDIYDFIISEMDAIISDLPEQRSTEHGRPSKYAALALKTRAALYAASIANFGTVQLNGILGISQSLSTKYYQTAFDAAATIINSNAFTLYNKDADKIANFKNIFLARNNSEVIWAICHDNTPRVSGGNGWIWDFFQCPKPQAWNAGNQNAPYLEMVEEYEYIDGTSGTLNRNTVQQKLWASDELWANKDPRFFATFYTQDTPWKGSKVDFHNGLVLPDGTIQNNDSYQGILAKGNQSVDGSFGTGFGVMKYLDESHSNMGERASSGTDWQLFRYAEVLLNYAEAAYELGKNAEALNVINQIRTRAGIASLSSITREKIRHERKVELAFEGHRYWDLRRWRVATNELTKNRSGIRYILDYNTRKYKVNIIDKIDGGISDPVFYERMYYFPITTTRTGNNPNLVENPGY